MNALGGCLNFLIGVNDNGNEGSFNTINGYRNWADNEPNNGKVLFIKLWDENAVVMKPNGKWMDVSTTLHKTRC